MKKSSINTILEQRNNNNALTLVKLPSSSWHWLFIVRYPSSRRRTIRHLAGLFDWFDAWPNVGVDEKWTTVIRTITRNFCKVFKWSNTGLWLWLFERVLQDRVVSVIESDRLRQLSNECRFLLTVRCWSYAFVKLAVGIIDNRCGVRWEI